MTKILQTTIVNDNDIQIIVDFEATQSYNEIEYPDEQPNSMEMTYIYRILRVSLLMGKNTLDITNKCKDTDFREFLHEQIDIDIHDLFEPR